MKRSTAVLMLFLAILLLAAFFTSCTKQERWVVREKSIFRAKAGTELKQVSLPVGYKQGDTVEYTVSLSYVLVRKAQ